MNGAGTHPHGSCFVDWRLRMSSGLPSRAWLFGALLRYLSAQYPDENRKIDITARANSRWTKVRQGWAEVDCEEEES